ncbi:hypothetical protein F5051DRAFT_484950 [Lentinula edodes]|nr:hypothetical protein F5051DRAFT_484950 [Lentinula edodes]
MSDPSRLSTTPDIDDEEDRHNQVAVWNTLLEFYLTLPGISSSLGSSVPQDEVALKEKALRVFRSETMLYDTTHALFLMLEPRIYQGFSPSLRDMGMSEDVLRIWMERNKERATNGNGLARTEWKQSQSSIKFSSFLIQSSRGFFMLLVALLVVGNWICAVFILCVTTSIIKAAYPTTRPDALTALGHTLYTRDTEE